MLISLQFAAVSGIGQIDTMIQIQEIVFSAGVQRLQNWGSKSEVISNNSSIEYSGKDLGQLLTEATGIHSKSYGSNSLTTSSIRGGSAGHTLVLWNGIPLLSPTLGLLDLALIPNDHHSVVEVSKGGTSSLFGSGAIGGIVNLENQAYDNSPTLNINVQFGSFKRQSLSVKSDYKFGTHKAKTQFSHKQAKNDFGFLRAPNHPLEILKHAAFLSTNLSQDFYINLNQNNKLKIHYWWQESIKQIPATITQNKNESDQKDHAKRLLCSWIRNGQNDMLEIKLATFKEWQKYQDAAINLNSRNSFTSLISDLSYRRKLGVKQEILSGTTFIFTRANTDGFNESKQELRTSAWLTHRYQGKKIKLQSSLRTELIDGMVIPLTPSFGFEMMLTKRLLFFGKVSRNYRLPTLNDRYWIPGGNVNLLPEIGWSQELSIKSSWSDNSQLILSLYNRKINNWILWTPLANQVFWSAQNLSKVWSRGIEIEHKQQLNIGVIELEIRNFYNLVKSTNEVGILLPNIPKGEQLIYTPIHQLTNAITAKLQTFDLTLQHIYRSKNKGINEDIKAYHLFNAMIKYETTLFSQKTFFFIDVNNIFNTNYFIIERRPMPRANFNLGFNLILN